jgi:hypothetical protein
MIDQIFIPTYRRTAKQKTFDNLPKKYQDISVLVVAEDEKDILGKNYPVIVCPCQGKGPEGSDPLDYGLSPTRKWIAYHVDPTYKYAVFDDDLGEFVYTLRDSERKTRGETLVNTPINYEGSERFDEAMETMSNLLDEYVTTGFEVTWNPPFETDFGICWRQTTNHFYNAKTFPKEKIDFTGLKCAQDYYILLQLLTQGYQNAVSFRYRVRPELTSADGGCQEYRTIQVHNESMEKLKEAFPDFVTIRTKQQKNGKWKGMDKHAATIQWKKAYASSQKEKENTLDGLF